MSPYLNMQHPDARSRWALRGALILLAGLVSLSLVFTTYSSRSFFRSSLSSHFRGTQSPQQQAEQQPQGEPVQRLLPQETCPDLPGIDDLYVIVKTGAATAMDRLPVHFNTTLRCVTDYVIYSNLEESIEGHQVQDALNEVSTDILKTHEEFDIYRRVKEAGRDGVHPDDIPTTTEDVNGLGLDAIGWKLDKWKFLPILEKAWRDRPSAKWFVFMEDDTYISWPNMLAYVAQLDENKPLYAGAQMQIGDTTFAHGGSGYIISREAMRLAVERRRNHLVEYDELTAREWAGDCVLGHIMNDINNGVFYAWPNFQGKTQGTIDFPDNDKWCQGALTFHHMVPEQIQELWDFERRTYAARDNKTLLYADVYEELIKENIKARGPVAVDWDNLSESEESSTELTSEDGASPMTQCLSLCEADAECMQYKVTNGTKCDMSKRVQLGEAKDGVESGWMMKRLDELRGRLGDCPQPVWRLPERHVEEPKPDEGDSKPEEGEPKSDEGEPKSSEQEEPKPKEEEP